MTTLAPPRRRDAARAAWLAPLLLLPSLLGFVEAVAADERSCLMSYVRLRATPDAALEALRECGRQHPESFAIQRTLGRRLAERAETDPSVREEAIRHFELAAAADPAQLADDWRLLARLLQDAGRATDAGEAYREATAFVTVPERLAILDMLWELHRELGDDEAALATWREIWHRHEDDFESQLAAARLLEEAGEKEEAKSRYTRALQLRPDHAGAQRAHEALLVATASGGGSAEKRALLESWLPRLRDADEAMLETLLEAARATYWSDAAERVARRLVEVDPSHARAHLVLAEQRAGEAGQVARRHAERALAGALDAGERAAAHEIAGRTLLADAHARYAAAGSSANRHLVESTAGDLRRAMRHLEQAMDAGRSVEDALANIERSLATLGDLSGDITAARREAARDRCSALASEARFRYEKDDPLSRTSVRTVRLSRSAGATASLGTLEAGVSVDVSDAAWADGSCWLEARASDGTQGWAKASALGGGI